MRPPGTAGPIVVPVSAGSSVLVSADVGFAPDFDVAIPVAVVAVVPMHKESQQLLYRCQQIPAIV